jgi:hypothetical protein
VSVQGNIDPTMLFATKDAIAGAVEDCLRKAGGRGHILNLGHGVLVGAAAPPPLHVLRLALHVRQLAAPGTLATPGPAGAGAARHWALRVRAGACGAWRQQHALALAPPATMALPARSSCRCRSRQARGQLPSWSRRCRALQVGTPEESVAHMFELSKQIKYKDLQ